MRTVPIKNYIILLILLITTVILTLLSASIYLQKNKKESVAYQYFNEIMITELGEYIIENPNSIVYISDKYDLSKEHFELEFKEKIEELNLNSQVVFIDKNSIKGNIKKELNDKYKIDMLSTNNPIVLVFNDSLVIESAIVDENTNVDEFIDYGVFK